MRGMQYSKGQMRDARGSGEANGQQAKGQEKPEGTRDGRGIDGGSRAVSGRR